MRIRNVLNMCFRLVYSFLLIILAGCGSNLAPVTELKSHSYYRLPKTHRIKPRETLYAIAFRYDTDYRTLARLNHIQPPYFLRIGQVLNLQGIATRHKHTLPTARTQSYYGGGPRVKQVMVYSPAKRYIRSASGWLWPVSGHVVSSFIPEKGKKGINIACKKDEKVIAAADGVVAYAGSGLTGYGNLIIIKHNHQYLTAYGNNARILVTEGQHVKSGQKIAIAGVIDHKYTGLHFEIRKSGIPVNPLHYLPKG